MDAIAIIFNAAKVAKISGILLLGICSHESNAFTMNYSKNDHGSASIGICQVKLATSRMVGFNLTEKQLMNPRINALVAARYLKFQQRRYGNDWVLLTASYNAGRYNPSSKVPGCPKNLKYVRLVQKRLPEEFKSRLQCGGTEVAEIGTN